ncbi:hypothetical protein [Spongiactinospora sp. 9N601]|uniref:hypothetical protein n=1 Tax=Spongiactinospora sp. 9N601 TaxID=3375149 RepID=UPI0037A61437
MHNLRITAAAYAGVVPNSFSRFLSPEELDRVRELYLDSLAALEAEEESPQVPDGGTAGQRRSEQD